MTSNVGQRRGKCGHQMAAFDLHQRCARCRENKKGEDPCVRGDPCNLCEDFTPSQRSQLERHVYQNRAQKAASLKAECSAAHVQAGLRNRNRKALVVTLKLFKILTHFSVSTAIPVLQDRNRNQVQCKKWPLQIQDWFTLTVLLTVCMISHQSCLLLEVGEGLLADRLPHRPQRGSQRSSEERQRFLLWNSRLPCPRLSLTFRDVCLS